MQDEVSILDMLNDGLLALAEATIVLIELQGQQASTMPLRATGQAIGTGDHLACAVLLPSRAVRCLNARSVEYTALVYACVLGFVLG